MTDRELLKRQIGLQEQQLLVGERISRQLTEIYLLFARRDASRSGVQPVEQVAPLSREARLLAAIHQSMDATPFTAEDVVEHAQLSDPGLHEELQAVFGSLNASTARRVGKMLSSIKAKESLAPRLILRRARRTGAGWEWSITCKSCK